MKVKYSNEFKAQVVCSFLNGNTPYQVSKMYSVDPKTVKSWASTADKDQELSSEIVKSLSQKKLADLKK